MVDGADVVSVTPRDEPQTTRAPCSPVDEIVMMSGRAYVRRPVAWHGAYFAEELVLVDDAR